MLITLLLGGVSLASAFQPASAQTVQATPTVTPNVVPTLQAVVATQQVEIEQLKRDLNENNRDRMFDIRDLQWKWGIAAALGSAAILVASWFGMNSMNDVKTKLDETKRNWENNVDSLEKEWEKRSQLLLDKAIYKFDPSNLPIKLPANSTNIYMLLSRRKLGKIEFYENLADLDGDKLTGVIVVSMVDKDTFAADEDYFRTFVKSRKLDTALTGFVLYTGPNRATDATTGVYDNLVTANYPGTVVSNILVVGRGLEIEE